MTTAQTLLGHLIIPATFKHRELFEFAAWFRDHEITPGSYPVYLQRMGSYGVPVYLVEVPTTVVDANFRSHFGGVGYGEDTAGQKEIGTASTMRFGNGSYDFKPEKAPFWWMEGKATFTPVAGEVAA